MASLVLSRQVSKQLTYVAKQLLRYNVARSCHRACLQTSELYRILAIENQHFCHSLCWVKANKHTEATGPVMLTCASFKHYEKKKKKRKLDSYSSYYYQWFHQSLQWQDDC